ncbi:MAG: hypothetical protein HPY66_3432 [Firmicutes bacterium]|nr:hypothetical protein [Bacillota bacterium]
MLGLDIGSSNIKWIVYGGSCKTPVIHNWGMVKTPQDSLRDGRIIDKHGLLEKIKEVLASGEKKISKASITLSCPEMIIRTLELPKMNFREMDSVINYEAEQFIPVNAGEYISDYRIIGEVERDGARLNRVLLAAVPSGIVQGYVELLEGLGVKPGAVDFHGNSAARLLSRYPSVSSDGSFAILDLGASTTTISITEKGIPMFTRVVQNGSEEITRSIANSFNLSIEDGEKYKILHGRVLNEGEEPQEGMVRDMLEGVMPVVEYLISDVYRSIEFYKTRTGSQINSMALIGGGSYLPGLGEYLSSHLSLEYRRIEGELPLKIKNGFDNDQLLFYANVLGLAYREER